MLLVFPDPVKETFWLFSLWWFGLNKELKKAPLRCKRAITVNKSGYLN
jgi:hypothetical protein